MFLVYFFLLIIGTISAFLSQRKKKGINKADKFYPLPFLLSFAIVWYYTVFTNCGSDYDNYYQIIDIVSWDSPIFGTSEIGFNLLCAAIKSIVVSPDIVIAVLKTMTLLLIYTSLFFLREYINIGFSYFVFILLFWLPSLFVIPLFLSSALCLLAFTIFLLRGKRVWPIVIIILAAQIHTASYFALLFYLLVFYLRDKSSYTFTNVLLLIFAFIGSVMISMLVNYLSSRLGDFHYGEYERNAGGTGLKTIVEYMLLFAVVVLFYTQTKNKYLSELLFVFLVFDLMISIINFSYGNAGRVHYLIMGEYLVLFSYYVRNFNKKTILPILLLLFICCVNGSLTYMNFTQGADPYVNYRYFNPFKTL